MATESSGKLKAKFQQAQEQKFCPECGAHMVKVDRRNEDGALFVWYECSRDNCDGQWLQKTPDRPDQQ